MKKILILLAFLIAPLSVSAQTPTTYELIDGGLVQHNVRAFTCQTNLLCIAHVPIDYTGTPFGTTTNPFFVSPASGATFPISGSVTITGTPPLPSGGATAANQASQITQETAFNTNLGVPSTSPCSAYNSACNANQILQLIAQIAQSSVAACSAAPCLTTIGNVGIDPSSRSPLSAAINISSATTTQLVALSGSTSIYVTSYDIIAGGTGNITFEYGTGSNCGTGTTPLTGAYPLTAQAGISKGSGVGTILKVPSGNALCALTSAGVQMSGSVSYMQF
jgi:hypothetical protein